jgi:hypothetical protein
MLLIPGESPKTEQTLLGHSRLSITMDIYAHTAPETETNAVAELTHAIAGWPITSDVSVAVGLLSKGIERCCDDHAID